MPTTDRPTFTFDTDNITYFDTSAETLERAVRLYWQRRDERLAQERKAQIREP